MQADGIVAIEPISSPAGGRLGLLHPRRTSTVRRGFLFAGSFIATRCACSGQPRDRRSGNHFMVSHVGNRQRGALPWRTPINYETAQAVCSRWR